MKGVFVGGVVAKVSDGGVGREFADENLDGVALVAAGAQLNAAVKEKDTHVGAAGEGAEQFLDMLAGVGCGVRGRAAPMNGDGVGLFFNPDTGPHICAEVLSTEAAAGLGKCGAMVRGDFFAVD